MRNFDQDVVSFRVVWPADRAFADPLKALMEGAVSSRDQRVCIDIPSELNLSGLVDRLDLSYQD